MENEIWVPIEEVNGLYEVSNFGKVKNIMSGKILSAKNAKGWYLSVTLKKGKNYKTFRIHRLVAQCFIPNPENKPEVNHKDLNRQNNHVDNLEWVTSAENTSHMRILYPNMIGQWNKENRSKKVVQLSLSGDYIATYKSSAEAGISTGVCVRNIHQVANKTEFSSGRTRKQAGGFRWVYESEYNK